MNISLTGDLERLVQRKVESGSYRSAADVICAGLRLLEREDEVRLTEIRAQVQAGIEQAERGGFVDGEDAVARVKRRASEKRRRAAE